MVKIVLLNPKYPAISNKIARNITIGINAIFVLLKSTSDKSKQPIVIFIMINIAISHNNALREKNIPMLAFKTPIRLFIFDADKTW